MSNSLLTPVTITREAQRILHQKLNFVGTINRQYDDSFAKSGAKIGESLKIRMPNKYTVRTGRVMDVQDQNEQSVTLTVATQKGVDMNFNSAELTLTIDDFSKRYIEPAMSVLAAHIEADAMAMRLDVYNQANESTLTNPLSFETLLNAQRILVENLVPPGDLIANLQPRQTVDVVSAVKALFNDSTQIAKQYKTGKMGTAAGFDFYQNTLWTRHTSGANAGTGWTVNGATESGSAVTLQSGSGGFKKGDIITLAGCYRVHPETKAVTGDLQQFVVTEDFTSGDVSISPSIIISGALQNVSGYPTDTGAVTKVGAASKTYDCGLAYHSDAFAFATADLVMPDGVDFKARKVIDGISLRLVRQYDINNDQMPCRLDVLYGYETIRPELACRIASKQDA